MTHPYRVLSPAFPSELLSYITAYTIYPTTLVVCGSRADFMSALIKDVSFKASDSTSSPTVEGQAAELGDVHQEEGPGGPACLARSILLSTPLYQIAISRHIRVVFVPTVSHLRAFLSVFLPEDSSSAARPPPPPTKGQAPKKTKPAPAPLLLVYGLLGLHHNTSEWSAQGLSCTAAGLVEAARRGSFDGVIVEPRMSGRQGSGMEAILAEDMPVLSGSMRRLAPDGSVWTGRSVSVKKVLGRWFHFADGPWKTGEVAAG